MAEMCRPPGENLTAGISAGDPLRTAGSLREIHYEQPDLYGRSTTNSRISVGDLENKKGLRF